MNGKLIITKIIIRYMKKSEKLMQNVDKDKILTAILAISNAKEEMSKVRNTPICLRLLDQY